MESGDVVADPWIERWVPGMSPWIPRMPSRGEEKSRWNPEMSSRIPGSSDGFSGCRRGFPGCRPKRRRSRDEIWRCRCNFPRPLLDPPPLRGRGRHRPALLPRLFRDGIDDRRSGDGRGRWRRVCAGPGVAFRAPGPVDAAVTRREPQRGGRAPRGRALRWRVPSRRHGGTATTSTRCGLGRGCRPAAPYGRSRRRHRAHPALPKLSALVAEEIGGGEAETAAQDLLPRARGLRQPLTSLVRSLTRGMDSWRVTAAQKDQ